jgi:predicted RNase H-like HicB family nuclease
VARERSEDRFWGSKVKVVNFAIWREQITDLNVGHRHIAKPFAKWQAGLVMKLNAVFEPAKEGGYVCWLEEMPGVQSQGDSLAEARANLLEALQLAVEYLRERARQERSPQSVREIVDAPAL